MKHLLKAAVLAIAVLAGPAFAGGFDEAQRKEIGDIVRDYLLQHPEVLVEVGKKLEANQQAEEDAKRSAALESKAAEVFHSKDDFVAGNPKGDVTMVEFFDYNCGWCKKGLPEVLSMVEEDKNLRFVLKEFPIFGGDSDYAATAALASRKQGKYWDFHLAMLGHEGKVTRQTVDELAKQVGLDLDRLKADMKDPEIAEIIRKNHELAAALSIGGTPAFVIDKEVVPGYLPKDGLMASVTKVREEGGCKLC
ncbi:MAG: DsbA family protein [Hyphomicrobiales bacterium]